MKVAAVLAGAAGLVIAIFIISVLIGYALGWAFGIVFDHTWNSMAEWLRLPPDVSSGMFFAFTAAVGSFFRLSVSKKND